MNSLSFLQGEREIWQNLTSMLPDRRKNILQFTLSQLLDTQWSAPSPTLPPLLTPPTLSPRSLSPLSASRTPALLSTLSQELSLPSSLPLRWEQFCRVLGNCEVGAKCDFWVKTRLGILVKGSCIWANQVWPRAILTPSKWQKFKNVLAKSHKGDLPIGWDVFWLKAI